MKLYQYELQFDLEHDVWKSFNSTSQRMRYKSTLLCGTWAEVSPIKERIDMFMTHDLGFAQDHVKNMLPFFGDCGWIDFTDPFDGTIGYAMHKGGLRVFMTEEDDPEMLIHELDASEVADYLLKFMDITDHVFNAGIQPRGVESDYIVKLEAYENYGTF